MTLFIPIPFFVLIRLDGGPSFTDTHRHTQTNRGIQRHKQTQTHTHAHTERDHREIKGTSECCIFPFLCAPNMSTPNNDYFQRLKLSDLLDRTFSLYGSNFRVIITISLIMSIPMTVLALFQYSLTRTTTERYDSYMDRYQTRGGIEYLVDVVLTQILLQLWRAAIAMVICNAYIQVRPSTAQCLEHSVENIVALVMGALPLLLVRTLALTVGIIADSDLEKSLVAIIFAIMQFIVYMRTFMYVPAIVVEKKGAADALKRGFELSGYGPCFVFISVIIMGTLVTIVELLWQAIVTDVNMGMTGYSYAGMARILVLQVITQPPSFILETVLYLHFRVERESLNQDVLIQDITGSTPIFDRTPNGGSYEPVIALGDSIDPEEVA